MTKLQWIVVGTALLLFLVLYFGGRTKPLKVKQLDKTRALTEQSISIEEILIESKAGLNQNQTASLKDLEGQLKEAKSDLDKMEVFKKISGYWYALGNYILSAYYAEEVAHLDGTDEAWSIAGINYAVSVQNTTNENIRKFAQENAVKAFENAIAENPKNESHRFNLGQLYMKLPGQAMKGVMMMRGLLEDNPDNLKVLLHLGKLSVTQTKDYEKALPRLTHAVKIAPKNVEANYYLAETYKGLGDNSSAKKYYEKCLALSEDEVFINSIKDILKTIN